MKPLICLLMVLFSVNTYARQYIQCSDYATSNRVVVNLDGENSTVFITDGVHHPDSIRILKKLELIKKNKDFHIFKSEKQKTIELIRIPSKNIGVRSNDFEINLEIRSTTNQYLIDHDLSCYSSIYN